MSENYTKKKWYQSWGFRIPFIILLVLLFSFCSLVVVRGFQFKKEFAANPLSVNQKNNLDLLLKNKYSERYQIIQKLPYNLDGQKLSVGAASAILIDVANGNVIYEKNADEVIAFCQGVQAAAPVDSYVKPEPWAMPGYEDEVIMAAGAFIQGSSIELSADAPIRPPYNVYFQGGLTFDHSKMGTLKAVEYMKKLNK